MNIRRIVVSIALGVLILFIAFRIAGAMMASKEPAGRTHPRASVREVSTVRIDNQRHTPEVSFLGQLQALDRQELFAEVNGVMLNTGKRFREGTRYNAGETLLRLDDEEARLNLVSQKSNFLSTLTAALPDMRLDFPERYSVWEAYAGSIDVTKALPELPESTSQKEKFFLSGRGILNQYYAIESQQARLSKYRITAQFSGVLSEAMITEGTLVRAGQKLGTFLATTDFELSGTVPRDVALRVAPGDSIHLSSESGKAYVAIVSRVGKTVDPSTQSTKIFARVKGEGLRDGQYLNGAIQTQSLENVMPVSNGWFQGENTLFTVQDSVLKEVDVEVLHRGENQSLVRGLPQGEWLMAEGLSKAYDGMNVKRKAP